MREIVVAVRLIRLYKRVTLNSMICILTLPSNSQ